MKNSLLFFYLPGRKEAKKRAFDRCITSFIIAKLPTGGL
jgi:hypothetical protein